MNKPSEIEITAWARLIRVSGVLVQEVEADLKAAGLPPLAWYDVLLELKRVGADGLRPHELQQAVLLAQYNLSRLIDRMARAGLVERRPCPTDGRGQVVAATTDGLAMLRRMWPVYRDAISRRFAERLGPGEPEALARLLARLA